VKIQIDGHTASRMSVRGISPADIVEVIRDETSVQAADERRVKGLPV